MPHNISLKYAAPTIASDLTTVLAAANCMTRCKWNCFWVTVGATAWCASWVAATPAGQVLPTQDRDDTGSRENSIGNPDLSSGSYLEGLMENRWWRETSWCAHSVLWQGNYFSAVSTCKKSPPLKFSSALSTKHRMLLPWKRWMKLLSFSPPTPASALPENASSS